MTVQETTSYTNGDGTELAVDIFYPQNRLRSMPALVLVFGGSWVRGSRSRFYPEARYFTERGYVVLTPDYRVFDRGWVSPRECVDDIVYFWRWLHKHAEALAIHPARMALGGGSAGGHLAILAGMKTGIYPKAYVLYNPVLRTTGEVFWNKLLSPEREKFPPLKDKRLTYEDFRDIDPFCQLGKTFPPSIFIQGELDEKAPLRDMNAFVERLRQIGTPVETYVYPNVGHGFFDSARSQQYFELTVVQVERFLEKYL